MTDSLPTTTKQAWVLARYIMLILAPFGHVWYLGEMMIRHVLSSLPIDFILMDHPLTTMFRLP